MHKQQGAHWFFITLESSWTSPLPPHLPALKSGVCPHIFVLLPPTATSTFLLQRHKHSSRSSRWECVFCCKMHLLPPTPALHQSTPRELHGGKGTVTTLHHSSDEVFHDHLKTVLWKLTFHITHTSQLFWNDNIFVFCETCSFLIFLCYFPVISEV